jgi:hypothetical protein
MNMLIRTPSAGNNPLHVISPSGAIMRSFGNRRTASPVDTPSIARTIALARDGAHIWITAPGEYKYAIQKWTLEGHQVQQIEVEGAPWFAKPKPPAPPPGDFFYSVPPQTDVRILREDAEGRIWVFIVLPDAKWKPQPPPRSMRISIQEIDEKFDTIVEVLDLNAKVILGSQRFDQLLEPVYNTEMVWSSREDADGVTIVDVWVLRLRQ